MKTYGKKEEKEGGGKRRKVIESGEKKGNSTDNEYHNDTEYTTNRNPTTPSIYSSTRTPRTHLKHGGKVNRPRRFHHTQFPENSTSQIAPEELVDQRDPNKDGESSRQKAKFKSSLSCGAVAGGWR